VATEGGAHTQSILGRDYWLRRCEGFRVDGPEGRIGHVYSIRFGGSAEPDLLEVRAGLLGRRMLLIPVAQVAEVIPEERRLVLAGSPRLAGSRRVSD
jgi:hypothetical protein